MSHHSLKTASVPSQTSFHDILMSTRDILAAWPRAQQLVLIHGDARTMLFAGDLVPTASHLPVPWVMGYDNEPIKTIQEKKEILGRAVHENWLLFFEHDPEIRCVRVKEGEKGYEVDEVIEFDYE